MPRSAALTASAIMNCMLDTSTSTKIKVEQIDSEDETINAQITEDKGETEGSEASQGAAHRLKTPSQKKGNGEDKKHDASDIVIKTEEGGDKTESDSDMDKVTPEEKIKVKMKVGRKKKKERSKKRRPEMSELLVGRRMASLNASAMMQGGFVGGERGHRWSTNILAAVRGAKTGG